MKHVSDVSVAMTSLAWVVLPLILCALFEFKRRAGINKRLNLKANRVACLPPKSWKGFGCSVFPQCLIKGLERFDLLSS